MSMIPASLRALGAGTLLITNGSIVSNYGKGEGFQFDVMAGGKFSKQFGVGVDVSF